MTYGGSNRESITTITSTRQQDPLSSQYKLLERLEPRLTVPYA